MHPTRRHRLITLLLVLVSTTAPRAQAQGKPSELSILKLPGPLVTMPEPQNKVAPTYPSDSSISGTVEVEISVSTTGTVMDARVTKSLGATVDDRCRASAERWTFAPAVTNNPQRTPVPALVLLRFEFVAPHGNDPGTVSPTLTVVPDRVDIAQIPNNAVSPGPGQSGVTVPTLLRNVAPSYTEAAMRARVQGDVQIEAIVMPDGTIGLARVVKSLDAQSGLDQEALRAARHWLFKPGTMNGQRVPVIVTLVLSFRLH